MWFADFAPLYEALNARGVDPRAADLLEIWEVAAVLGAADDQQDGPQRDFVAERIAAARSGAPPPRADGPGTGVANLLRGPGAK